MSRAGKSFSAVICGIAVVTGLSGFALGQTQPVPATQADTKVSSLTVQQIVARRQAHFNSIQTSMGTAVWREMRYDGPDKLLSATERVIYFGKAGIDDSVCLVMNREGAKKYGFSQGSIPWSDVMVATMVKNDWVYSINPDTATSSPEVIRTPYNPAVHDNNPLVVFDISHIGEERIPLRELAQAIPDMPTKPNVFDFKINGKPFHRIEFVNSNAPGEVFYYIVDPAKAWMTTEMGRISRNKIMLRTKVIVGNTPDGTWIPARKEREQFDSSGKLISKDSWFFESLAVNERLPAKMLSYMFFNLPETTKVITAEGPKQASQPKSSVPPPAALPTAAPTKTPRVAPTPLIVPIGRK